MRSALLPLFFCLILTSEAQIKTGTLAWQFPASGKIIATPCIEGDNIYFGSADGTFYCIALESGKLIWKYNAGKAIISSASAGQEKVFFGCEDGYIYALDARNGGLEWKFRTKGERNYDTWDYYRSSPQYVNGKVYAGSGDGNVYALNAKSGKELWRYKTGDIVHADAVIQSDTLYIGSFDGNFYALHAASGKLLWKFKTIGDRFFPKGEVQKAALVTKDAVYFGSRDYNLYALDKRTGKGLWNRKEYGSWIIATPIEKEGKLFFGTSDSYAFYSLNNFYGEEGWKAAMPMRSYATPAWHDTLIFAGCFNGYLYGFGQQKGEVKWTFQTNGSKKNYLQVYDSTGHFRKDFNLYGDDSTIRAGEEKIFDLGAIISSPVVRQDRIYFGSTDGSLYAVKIE